MNTIKNSIFFAALLLVVIAFSACEKESQTTITTETNQQLATESSTAVRAKIENFLQNVENPSLLKSGQTMSLDSAVWYTEAALNFTAGNTSYLSNTAQINREHSVEVIDDKIPATSLVQLYTDMQDELTEIIAEFPDSVVVNLIDVSKKESDVKNDETIFTVNYLVSTDAVEPPPSSSPFTEDDYWYPTQEQGRCDGMFAGILSADGVLANTANTRLFPPHHTFYFTDVEDTEIYPFMYPYSSPHGNYLLWTDDIYSSTDCLPPDAMQFYLEGLEFIGEDISSNFPAKEVSNYYCHWDASLGERYMLHRAIISVGVKHYY